jgi:hypothetical protein
VVIFAGEQRFGFEFRDVGFGAVEFAIDVFQEVVALIGVGFFLREIDVGLDVFGNRGELVVGADLVFGAFAVAENGLGAFLIVPKTGIGDAGFERLQALAMLGGVKDSSARA